MAAWAGEGRKGARSCAPPPKPIQSHTTGMASPPRLRTLRAAEQAHFKSGPLRGAATRAYRNREWRMSVRSLNDRDRQHRTDDALKIDRSADRNGILAALGGVASI